MATLTDERSTEGTPQVPAASTWSLVRPLVLRLHFYAGVLVGPFILLAAFTGLLYTAAPQIEAVAYHDLTHVTPTGGEASLGEQVAAARASHPSGTVLEVDPPEAADRSTRVVFSDPTVPADYAMSVFVNPYDAQVVGHVRSFGQWLGFRAWLDELHRNLHLGAVGRNYSELAASWTWVVALGGVALWFTRRRRERSRRPLVVPDLSTSGRRRNLSWHGVLGTWIVVGLLGLSVTGLTWSRWAGANVSDLLTAMNWRSPSPSTEISGTETPSEADGHAGHLETSAQKSSGRDAAITAGVGIDGVYDTARRAGLGNPLVLTPPAGRGAAWTAGENKRSWPTHYDTITVDPADGQVVDRVNFASWPFMAKLSDWVIGLHMGILLGLPNQLLLAGVAIALIVLVLRGYRMWWLRRPTRARGLRFGPAPARGAWRRVPTPGLAGLAVLTVVVGYLVPLLGVSLVAFLVLDGLLGLARRGRHGDRAGSESV